MNTGQKISGAAHLLLIGWALFGGTFRSEPLPFEAVDVSVISSQEFAALTSGGGGPAAPEAPSVSEPAPVTPADTPAPTPRPEPAPRPEPQPAPEPAPAPVPRPQPPAEVTDTAPETPELPQPLEESPRPDPQSVRPALRPAERVAPTPAPEPEPEAQVAEVETPATTPDAAAETPAPETEAAAPEAASPEIVTEANESDSPGGSPRPRTRPRAVAAAAARAEAAAQAQPAAQAETPVQSSAVDDAVAAALGQATGGGGQSGAGPAGPPLTRGERDGLRLAVQRCWVVDVGSRAADVTVTVGFSLDRSGKVVGNAVRQISASGGDRAAQKSAFEAARRAVLRCQAGGYSLPAEKYDSWKDVEVTFNPDQMRLR